MPLRDRRVDGMRERASKSPPVRKVSRREKGRFLKCKTILEELG